MAVVHARTSRILFTLLVAASVVWGCDAAVKPSDSQPLVTASPSTSEASADAQASPSEAAEASESVEPSASLEPSASASAVVTASPTAGPTPTRTPITVRFTQSIADHRWGDPPFKVRATATGGKSVRFAADGGCRVDGQTGTVTIQTVGRCAITASVPDAKPPASASQTFRILRASPVITVKNQSTRFARPMQYRVKVSVSPRIPLKYAIDHRDPEDAWCKVTSAGILTFSHQPTKTDFPGIPFDCYVRISAAGTSPNYTTPSAKTAKVHLDYAAFHVTPVPKPIDFSTSHSVKVDIKETSGDALGMKVELNGGDCAISSVSPAQPKAGTTRYSVTVTAIGDPNVVGEYDCELTAQAEPQDYFPGNPLIPFKVHVSP